MFHLISEISQHLLDGVAQNCVQTFMAIIITYNLYLNTKVCRYVIHFLENSPISQNSNALCFLVYKESYEPSRNFNMHAVLGRHMKHLEHGKLSW